MRDKLLFALGVFAILYHKEPAPGVLLVPLPPSVGFLGTQPEEPDTSIHAEAH